MFSIILTLLSTVKAQESLPFLDLEVVEGTYTVSLLASNDAVSLPITATIPHYSGNASLVFVSENGAISFDTALPTPPQTPGPSLYQDARDTFLIAPYWADNNIVTRGSVRYEVYRRDHTDQEELFNLVSSFIENRTANSEAFEGSWMILVSWEECRPNVEMGNVISDQNNSFQAIVVTDGRSKSFAIFTYECNLTEWSGLGPIYVEIGVNYGDGRKVQHYLSGSERANEIDCNSQPNLTEVNLLFDLVDPTSISLPTRPPSIPPPATSFNPTVPITTFEVPASSRKLSGSILTVVPIAMVIMILASGMTRCKKGNTLEED